VDCDVESGSWMDDYFLHCDVDMDLAILEVDREGSLGRTNKGWSRVKIYSGRMETRMRKK
jgi:hypothetical protein